MAPHTDVSPSAPPSSAKGFKGAIAKVKSRKENSASPKPKGDSEDATASRGSQDSSDRPVKSRQDSLHGSVKGGSSGKVLKLLPSRSKKKRKNSQPQKSLESPDAELHRGRSLGDAGASGLLCAVSTNNSIMGSGDGSLVSVESDLDSATLARPKLSPHQSHTGYLTMTSPMVKATTTADPPLSTPPLPSDGDATGSPGRKSSTLPTYFQRQESEQKLSPLRATTFDGTHSPSPNQSPGSMSRGISPMGRFKNSLSSAQSKDEPPRSPNGRLSMVSSDNHSLGDLFKRRHSDKNSQPAANTSNEELPTASTPERTLAPELPTILTTPDTPPNPASATLETMVTPPTPTEQQRRHFATGSDIVVSPSGNMISHRRARSDSASHTPSKLSSAVGAPLTPMAEESRTPGGTLRATSQGSSIAGGFFSSVLNAAQSMTTTLTNSMTNQTRSPSSTQTSDGQRTARNSVEQQNKTSGSTAEKAPEEAPLAVHSLGTGELSLRHLGISTESLNNAPANGISVAKGDSRISLAREDSASSRIDGTSASRAVSIAYGDRGTGETLVVDDDASIKAKSSIYEASIVGGGERSPSYTEGLEPLRRSGSVRSRVGGRVRRHRNSSSTTGHTIAAAVGAGAALANPAGNKPTGFAVASKKRNRDFHHLFRSVPDDDYLIDDYSCALQREIILAGRIYISEGHICFSSNILGWVTTLVISFDEIVSVEKENTAVVFPNAIAIQTLHARHTFRSLLSRETTYELIIGIWKLSHPNLQSSVNGARLDRAGTGDKTEKVEASTSDDSDRSDSGEEVYDEDEESDGETNSVAENGSVHGSVGFDGTNSSSRKLSGLASTVGTAAALGPTTSDGKAAEKAASVSNATNDFPGPATHAPTECPDAATHLDKQLVDEVVAAPLGKVYSMIFGPASGGFMAKWLVDDMKCMDLQLEDDKKGLSDESKTRSLTYVKPLNAPIGPKSTKCIVTEVLDYIDLEKAVCVTQSTQSPDVPSGNVFVTKTHSCLTWAGNNATRVLMNYTIEWSGKSWLKTPIEKAATEGQTAYAQDLVKALKAGVAAPRRATTTGTKGKKGKRSPRSPSERAKSTSEEAEKQKKAQRRASWGPLEPVHQVISPVTDILAPLITSNTIIGILLFIILYNSLRRDSASASVRPSGTSADRLAAYEEIWNREEADLWDWLEQRAGMPDLRDVTPEAVVANAGADSRSFLSSGKSAKKQTKTKSSTKQKLLTDVHMSEQEVSHALRAAEDKLGLLKRIMTQDKKPDAGQDANE